MVQSPDQPVSHSSAALDHPGLTILGWRWPRTGLSLMWVFSADPRPLSRHSSMMPRAFSLCLGERKGAGNRPQTPRRGIEGLGKDQNFSRKWPGEVRASRCPRLSYDSIGGFPASGRGPDQTGKVAEAGCGAGCQWQPQALTTMLRCLRRMTLLLLS